MMREKYARKFRFRSKKRDIRREQKFISNLIDKCRKFGKKTGGPSYYSTFIEEFHDGNLYRAILVYNPMDIDGFGVYKNGEIFIRGYM